jgi:hypothetical protein
MFARYDENLHRKPPRPGELVIGSVIDNHERHPNYEAAYNCMLFIALKKYENEYTDIDIRSLVAERVVNPKTAIVIGKKKVVSAREASQAIDESIFKTLETVMNKALNGVPDKSRVAVVDVISHNRSIKNTIEDFVEEILLEKGFRPVDRKDLDKAREEQALQYNGEFDEKTWSEIGKFAGAAYVLTVRSDENSIRVRVLNTTTGEVAGNATQRF